MIKVLKKHGYFLLLCLFLSFGFLLRLKGLIANPSFWHDECSLGWNVIHKNYSDFFGMLRFLQIAPPFFMILSKLSTKIFGVSDFVLRLTPFFFGISSLLLFFILAHKVFQNKTSVFVSTFLFAINENMVNYSSEFKHYSCDVFFTIVCLILFFELISKKISFRKNIAFSFIFAVSIWFSFVSVFSLGAGFFVLFFKQVKEKDFKIKESLILLVPFFLSILLYLNFYLINTYHGNQTGMNAYWASGFIAKNLSNFASLLIFNINYFFFPIKFILFAFIFILLGAYIFTKKNPYMGVILLLTFGLECFASWLGIYPFEKRAILFLFPIFLIFICSIFETLNWKNKPKTILVSALFLLTFWTSLMFCYIYISKMPKPSRGYHSREMMAEMMKYIKPTDIILINQNSNTEFAYYSSFYDIENEIYQEPQKGNPAILINSFKPGRYYWFFMPHRPSPTVEKWLKQNKKDILFNMNGLKKAGWLDYVHVQNNVVVK